MIYLVFLFLFPLTMILGFIAMFKKPRGFAVAAYCNQDVAEDWKGADVATTGVFKVFGPRNLLERKPTEWGILSAWAARGSNIMLPLDSQ